MAEGSSNVNTRVIYCEKEEMSSSGSLSDKDLRDRTAGEVSPDDEGVGSID
eukprot:CAMPEP_0179922500 /NCGR_PEP_ID=MMETSP0983-20121128/5686_1 /TAXON_ID=483367 /ORGANISM="non described non described, Strain CCMP 2436" /LENGTH=50 /DNA_ID=CAMNT_0021825879 /DNA_START=933 /DNA_END=1085 /DNA_ORIENTATION=-